VAALAAAEVGPQVLRGQVQPGRQALDDDGQLGAVGLPGGEPAKHTWIIVTRTGRPPAAGPRPIWQHRSS
jgi:hypothetical protein